MKLRSVVLIAVLAAGTALAQTPGIRRSVIQKADLSAPGREAVVAKVELDAGATAGRHSHPGEEIGYVLEGEGDLLIYGEDPRHLEVGDSYIIPAGTVHDAINTGKSTMRLVSVFVVEKGKPMATPAK
ncbi:cupin domain-containing protein [Duganella sp. FT80W]|uniref:Cupin domain-containing protein n=1 Tax=Duganella guangzhouensis TaxID=2666084 RepID=A0A6I2KYB6_9BURK|nr:cupin domain-containing protein [Duganella guangzhouensis]MRW90811.1 cupin domain-containing protein [Duganella guangzhouensis]